MGRDKANERKTKEKFNNLLQLNTAAAAADSAVHKKQLLFE